MSGFNYIDEDQVRRAEEFVYKYSRGYSESIPGSQTKGMTLKQNISG